MFLADQTRQNLENQTLSRKDYLSKNGLHLNIKKTEYLQCGAQTDDTISTEGQPLAKTTRFKYLGSLITSDGKTFLDARAQVNAAWLKWHQVTAVQFDMKVHNHLKGKVYKSIVCPVALYSSVLASFNKARASPPRNGDENVALVHGCYKA